MLVNFQISCPRRYASCMQKSLQGVHAHFLFVQHNSPFSFSFKISYYLSNFCLFESPLLTRDLVIRRRNFECYLWSNTSLIGENWEILGKIERRKGGKLDQSRLIYYTEYSEQRNPEELCARPTQTRI